jgi:ABC-type uncharacterized transport system substrate-binding protein
LAKAVAHLKVCAMRGMAAIFGVLMAGPALAHPHVFIDAGIEVLINDRNEATGLRISWTYDDLYSLYVIGDMGLDPDWDGKLTPDEVDRLSGFDMAWIPEFRGDTYALMGDAELALSGPTDWGAGYAGGRITSTHLRTFSEPVPLGSMPLIVQVYDPGYYTAYTIPDAAVLTGGAGCQAETFIPDVEAADKALLAALAEFTPDVDVEMSFPAVGKNYAEEVRITCPAK